MVMIRQLLGLALALTSCLAAESTPPPVISLNLEGMSVVDATHASLPCQASGHSE